jgi:hypothetical protein
MLADFWHIYKLHFTLFDNPLDECRYLRSIINCPILCWRSCGESPIMKLKAQLDELQRVFHQQSQHYKRWEKPSF